jgi:hypothetical protein
MNAIATATTLCSPHPTIAAVDPQLLLEDVSQLPASARLMSLGGFEVFIALLLDRPPEIAHLFGPVSVSPRFSEFGRMLIMSALPLHHMDEGLKPLIRARNAPRAAAYAGWQEQLTEVSSGLADPGAFILVFAAP